MKPISFVAALAPILALAALALVGITGLHWLSALGAFYGSLAIGELGYLAGMLIRYRPERAAGTVRRWELRRS